MEKLASEIETIFEQVKSKSTLEQIPDILVQLGEYSTKIKNTISPPTTGRSISLQECHRHTLEEVHKFIVQLRDSYGDISNNNNTPIRSSSSDHLSQSQEKEEEREKAIGETIVRAGELSFEDIAGLDVVKSLLHEAVILPVQYPHLFKGKVKPWKSVLLYGPPGTGKSTIAQAVSTEANCTFFSLSSSDLLSSWFGESEKLIKELFAQARSVERAIIFIDEIDSICRKRSSKEEETTRRIKNELLKQMDGFSSTAASRKPKNSTATTAATNDDSSQQPKRHLFVLCATNCPWELDTAFLRRFSKRIYIPLPDAVSREALFNIHLKDVHIKIEESDMEQLVQKTEGYSGSDISNCISEAVMEPIRELRDCSTWKWNDDKMSLSPTIKDDACAMNLRLENIPSDKVQPRQVNTDDLFRSISLNKKTVSQEETVRFNKFTEEFGQNG